MTDNTKLILSTTQATVEGKDPLSLEDVIQITLSALLGFMKQARDAAPEEFRQEATEQIYDTVNLAASNLLSLFAPEIEAREDLSEEAIYRAQNEILQERYDNATPEEKKAAEAAVARIKERLQKHIEDPATIPPMEEQTAHLAINYNATKGDLS